MSFELKLAWKYFRARRKSLARFTAAIAVVGIASGVAALIVAQALARGFADEMRDKILANTAHVTVFRKDGGQILDWETLKADLEKIENVREVSATTYESALVVGEKSTSYCVIRAIQRSDAETQSRVTENGKWKTENERSIEIRVGAELAEKTGLSVGDSAEIIFPNDAAAPQTSPVIIKEIFRTGLYDYDSTWIYVSFEDLARLSGNPVFLPTILSVSVKDIYAADKTAGEIRRTLGDEYKILDWQEANRPLFAALSLERKLSLAIISLIIFIAALNITTTLALLVNERRLDIAILRTCGAQTRSLLTVFLLEGLFLGFAGIVCGLALGLALCFVGNRFKLISLDADVYSLGYVPLHPQAFDILLIILVAFLLSLAATLYPALRAARIKPLENLRNQ